jgi:hypothetical protein
MARPAIGGDAPVADLIGGKLRAERGPDIREPDPAIGDQGSLGRQG